MRSTAAELPHYRRGVVMALLSSLCAAGFVIPWKLASQHGAPEACVLVMLATAACLNSGLLLVPDKAPASRGREPRLLVAVAATMAALTLLGNYLSAQAVARMSAPLLSVLLRLEVFVVALLGALVLREYVRPAFWLGAGISLFGLVVLNAQKPSDGPGFDRVGSLFALGAALCFGSISVLGRKYIARVHPAMLNSLRLCFSVLLWFVFSEHLPDSSELLPSLVGYAALAGVFGPFLSRSALLESARYVPANVSALVALCTPVFALALGSIVLGSLPSTSELTGGAIMLAGIAVPFVHRAWAKRSI